MEKIRGLVGVIGLIAVALAATSQVSMMAQRDPEVRLLDERTKDSRERINALETSASSVVTRLTRIETELEMTRRTSEANGQLMTGLAVGIGLMLFERMLVLVGWIKKKSGGDGDD